MSTVHSLLAASDDHDACRGSCNVFLRLLHSFVLSRMWYTDPNVLRAQEWAVPTDVFIGISDRTHCEGGCDQHHATPLSQEYILETGDNGQKVVIDLTLDESPQKKQQR